MNPALFVCELCGNLLENTATAEEVEAERIAVFGKSVTAADCFSVCNECYERVNPRGNPHLVEQWVADLLRTRSSPTV